MLLAFLMGVSYIWLHLMDNFGTTLGQLWDNFGTILENIYGQFADVQFQGQFGENFMVNVGSDFGYKSPKLKHNLFIFIRNHHVMLWVFLMGVSYIWLRLMELWVSNQVFSTWTSQIGLLGQKADPSSMSLLRLGNGFFF